MARNPGSALVGLAVEWTGSCEAVFGLLSSALLAIVGSWKEAAGLPVWTLKRPQAWAFIAAVGGILEVSLLFSTVRFAGSKCSIFLHKKLGYPHSHLHFCRTPRHSRIATYSIQDPRSLAYTLSDTPLTPDHSALCCFGVSSHQIRPHVGCHS